MKRLGFSADGQFKKINRETSKHLRRNFVMEDVVVLEDIQEEPLPDAKYDSSTVPNAGGAKTDNQLLGSKQKDEMIMKGVEGFKL